MIEPGGRVELPTVREMGLRLKHEAEFEFVPSPEGV
jgi:hypothetical protein